MPHRKMAIVPVLLALAMLATVAVTGCTGDDNPTPSVTSSEAAFLPNTHLSTAPDGGVLKVIESGFSYDADVHRGSGAVQFGAILQNTSAQRVAVWTSVFVRFLDGNGGTVRVLGKDEMQANVPAVPPGGRMGVVGLELGQRPDQQPLPVKIEVRVGPSTWWPVSRVKKLEASDFKITEESAENASISFAVNCEYVGGVDDADVMVVLRDQSGKIVGGYQPVKSKLGLPWPSGRSQQKVLIGGVGGTGAVVERTELYVGPTSAAIRAANEAS